MKYLMNLLKDGDQYSISGEVFSQRLGNHFFTSPTVKMEKHIENLVDL